MTVNKRLLVIADNYFRVVNMYNGHLMQLNIQNNLNRYLIQLNSQYYDVIDFFFVKIL